MKDFLDKNRAGVTLGGIFIVFFTYQVVYSSLYPAPKPPKPLLFNDVAKTEEMFNYMRLGQLTYHCSNDEGWMYVGKRIGSPNGKNKGMVSIDIRGNCAKIDSLTLDCDVYKVSSQVRQNALNQYKESLNYTFSILNIAKPDIFDFAEPHTFTSAGYRVVTIPNKEYYSLKVYRQI